MLQCVVVCCSVLQDMLTRPCCSALQCVAGRDSVLQCVAVCRSVLQGLLTNAIPATHCDIPRHTSSHCKTVQHTAAHSNTQQHTAEHSASHSSTQLHTAEHCRTLMDDLFINSHAIGQCSKQHLLPHQQHYYPILYNIHIYMYIYTYTYQPLHQ